ncbi:MAG: M23 family metallopeptidase [Hyphomonadaceae bacterium]|nr:M23 family metallopeptidase [Hyphomonadaceae bacterium]
MRTVLVLILMALSFAGGVLFGQWTKIDFLSIVQGRIESLFVSEQKDTVPAEEPTVQPPEDSAPLEEIEPANEVPAETGMETLVEVPNPANTRFDFPSDLGICPRMTVANAPPVAADLAIVDYQPFVLAEDAVTLAVAPTEGCVSSGFGPRNGRTHKGLDFRTDTPGMVFAAAQGTVIEAHYRDDYGNQVVIDHGDGVFTRYAHLAAFRGSVREGAVVEAGTPLGPMGNTASYAIPVHLHYEVLVGDYDTPAKSFGLTAKSIFEYPFVEAY